MIPELKVGKGFKSCSIKIFFVLVLVLYLEMMGGRPLPAGELCSQLQAVAEQVVEVL